MKRIEEKNCKTIEELTTEVNKALERKNAAVLLDEEAVKHIPTLVAVKATPWDNWNQLYTIGKGDDKVIVTGVVDPEVLIFITYK